MPYFQLMLIFTRRLQIMPRFSTKPPPEDYATIEPTINDFERRLRDAENTPHEGKRVVEISWPIFQLNYQKSRYIYELYYQRQAISKELYDWCLETKIADASLIAKWKKVLFVCLMLGNNEILF